MAKKKARPNPAKRLPVHSRHVLDLIQEEIDIRDFTDIHEQMMLRVSSAEKALRYGAVPGRVE